MSGNDEGAAARRRRTYHLSRKMADAYAASAPLPAVDDIAKSSLASCLADRLDVGMIIGLPNPDLGDYVGPVIEKWEHENQRSPGPPSFEIDPNDDVKAIMG